MADRLYTVLSKDAEILYKGSDAEHAARTYRANPDSTSLSLGSWGWQTDGPREPNCTISEAKQWWEARRAMTTASNTQYAVATPGLQEARYYDPVSRLEHVEDKLSYYSEDSGAYIVQRETAYGPWTPLDTEKS